MKEIFKLEPNLRIGFNEIKEHKFFAGIVWSQVKSKLVEVPYVPKDVVGKYSYLLSQSVDHLLQESK